MDMSSDARYKGKRPHGSDTQKMARSQKFRTDYGKDASDVCKGNGERMGKFAGGCDDLSHSLSGTSASNQKA